MATTVKKILVPTDFSEHSYAAVRWAAALARDLSAELVLLHVIDSKSGYSIPPEFSLYLPEAEEIRRHVDRQLEALVGELPKAARARFVVAEGRAAPAILEVARNVRADLVVIASRGAGALAAAVFGGTVSKVLHEATCPVLVHPVARPGKVRRGGLRERRFHDAAGAHS
jgi:nucleotide-binding universal stress UspA family protein